MPTEQEISDYLVKLRDSGVTNMFGAGIYLQDKFSMDSREARSALAHWMKNFKESEDAQESNG